MVKFCGWCNNVQTPASDNLCGKAELVELWEGRFKLKIYQCIYTWAESGQTLLVKVNAPLKFRDATYTFHTILTMNSSPTAGDNGLGTDGNSIGSVSRSGRVRKKNSLLADYDSPDVADKRKPKAEKSHAHRGRGRPVGSTSRSHVKSSQLFRGKKNSGYGLSSYHNYESAGPPNNVYNSSFDITHEPFDGEVPDIAAEEIIDESLLEEESPAAELTRHHNFHHHASNVRLKSQAESTYMLEKSFEKHRKVGSGSGPKVKATRKDKGSSRVTAYMLWAKEQRANFAKKYPHMDFSSLSKKLSDLWATVPQNQKRMWKTKAAKIMRKNANGAENMKNSAPSLVLAQKPAPLLPLRKGMKNTTPQAILLPKRPPGRPRKALPLLIPTASTAAGPSTNVYNHYAHATSSRPPVQTSSTKNFSNRIVTNPVPSTSAAATLVEIKSEPYQAQVTGTDPLDIAAHFSLLGESLKRMGEKLQNAQDQPTNDSLSVLLDSMLCSMGPLLCLTQNVPELDCIPESQLKRILNNVDFLMPGL